MRAYAPGKHGRDVCAVERARMEEPARVCWCGYVHVLVPGERRKSECKSKSTKKAQRRRRSTDTNIRYILAGGRTAAGAVLQFGGRKMAAASGTRESAALHRHALDNVIVVFSFRNLFPHTRKAAYVTAWTAVFIQHILPSLPPETGLSHFGLTLSSLFFVFAYCCWC